MVQFQWIATDVPALQAAPPHAGTHSLDDQVAFQFGDRADDHHDGAALLSQEMSLSGYEYGALAGAPITAPKPLCRAEPAWRFDRS
jgi:hypothetical protein